MRIVIDARWIFQELSGIGLYTRELIRNLPAVDTQNKYYLIFEKEHLLKREMSDTVFRNAKNFVAQRIGCSVFSPLNQLEMPLVLHKLNADVFHSPNYMIPFFAFPRHRRGRMACVITIHDLIPLIFPHYTPRALKTRFFPLFKAVMQQSVTRADAIISPSESTRKDIGEHLFPGHSRSSNIHVVPQGVPEEYHPSKSPKAKEANILYVGRFDPYKNVHRLIEAYGLLRERGINSRLRIVGSADSRYPEARATAQRMNLDESIQWDGYLNGESLIKAYQQASVFVLPSRYEGFGLTVLEAMSCGTPVVCSNGSSLPEVVGNAALTVEPDNAAAIAEAIAKILEDPLTASRLRSAGIERAKKFTWRKTAELTAQVYSRIAVEQNPCS